MQFVRAPDTLRCCRDSSAVVQTLDEQGRFIVAPSGVWTSSNPSVLDVVSSRAVDNLGEEVVVRARGAGTADLKVTIGTRTLERRIVVLRALVEDLYFENDGLRIPVNSTRQLKWYALTGWGEVETPVAFAVLDPSIASVSPTGLVTALRPGFTAIRASVDLATRDATVLVPNVAPWSVKGPTGPVSVKLHRSASVSLTMRDAMGYPPVAQTGRLHARDELVASASGDGKGRLALYGHTLGRTDVVFRSEDVEAFSLRLDVVPNPVKQVTVAPATATMYVASSTVFHATTLDGDGVEVPRAVTWRSLDPTVAAVNASGEVTAIALGTAIVEASSESVVHRVTVRVVPPPTVRRITLTASGVSLVEGQRALIRTALFDSAGNGLVDRVVTWTSDNPAVARVDTGMVIGVSAGTTRIRASSGPTTAVADVRIMPANATGAFKVDVRFFGVVPAEVQAAFKRAAARWSDVIVGDVPDVHVTLKPEDCDAIIDPIDEVVDDVLVVVSMASLPAGVIGAAGTCWSRGGSDMPLVSAIIVNANVLSSLAEGNMLDLLAQHEIGHGLGLNSTVWTSKGLNASTSGVPFVYTGREGIQGYLAVGGSLIRHGGVPLEDRGGPGTAGSHWRYSELRPELMTGYLLPHQYTPLSRITLGAMLDLGYEVATVKADLFQPFATPARIGSQARGLELIERPIRLRGRIHRDGTREKIPR